VDSEGASIPRDLPFAGPRCHICLAVIGVRINPVVTGSIDGERRIRRIDLQVLVFRSANTHGESTFGQFHLYAPVIKVHKLKGCSGTEPEFRFRNLHLGPRSLIRKELVSDRERPVRRGLNPIVRTAWLK
jgi:hypothetical protein